MARRDGTGPMGQGSLTGKGMGSCTDEGVRRPTRRAIRSGRGTGPCGSGYGKGMRGRGYGGYPVDEPINTVSDKEWLNEEKANL